MKRFYWIVFVFLTSVCLADTNTPYPAGTQVSVTTSAGTVSGELQDIAVPQWIAVLEPNADDPTLIRATDVILRKLGPRSPSDIVPETVRPDLFRREMFRSERFLPDAFRTEGLRREAPRADAELEDATRGHYIFGRPLPTDDRFKFTPPGHDEEVSGITILVREAFTLGHGDKRKGPAWVAWSWTTSDYEAGIGVSMERPDFEEDEELPLYARGGTDFDFSLTQMERGHMCPDNDLESFGEDAVAEGMKMSNIIPQRKNRNHKVWTKLEEQTHNIVGSSSHDIDAIWIVSGPIYAADEGEIEYLGDDKAIPEATYKLIMWLGEEEEPHVREYIIDQNDTSLNLANYLTSVKEVETRTGLDFFYNLDDEVEVPLEEHVPTTIWE